MVQAVIDIDERANRVLNIIKAKHGLKDKSERIFGILKECRIADKGFCVKPENGKFCVLENVTVQFRGDDEPKGFEMGEL